MYFEDDTKMRYLSEIIGNSFYAWRNRKILIKAPTGMGKSTFILKVFIPYALLRQERTLILCNRRLLRDQYWYDCVNMLLDSGSIQKYVSIMTYQELAERLAGKGNLNDDLWGFAHIICDECHYFYADTDFNGFGTFVLLQVLINTCFRRNIIFMSATMDEIEPFLRKYIQEASKRYVHDYVVPEFASPSEREYLKQEYYQALERGLTLSDAEEDCNQIVEIDQTSYQNYERFSCFVAPDVNTLAKTLASSDCKSVIFIDNKRVASDFSELLTKYGMAKVDIDVINADNLDPRSEVAQSLSIAHRIPHRVLITTSVLDNGVSIHDSNVGNVVVVTNSQVSFIQMLGRIRGEHTTQCKLFFLVRKSEEFYRFMTRWEEKYRFIQDLDRKPYINSFYILRSMLNSDDELCEKYRSAFVLTNHQIRKLLLVDENDNQRRDDVVLIRNRISEAKVLEQRCVLSRLYSLAVQDPIEAVKEQMRWIGLDNLTLMESSFDEDSTREIREYLLQTVAGIGCKELSTVKEYLSGQYPRQLKKILPDVNFRADRAFDNSKFKALCAAIGLSLVEDEDADGHKRYSVRQVEAIEISERKM